MSPLGEAIYLVLVKRVTLADPLISFNDLVKKLPPLASPHDNIARNDPRLFQALSEVSRECLDRGLPPLVALVVRSMERTPGAGYFLASHPEIGDDPARRLEAWQTEVEKIKVAKYPLSTDPSSTVSNGSTPDPSKRTLPIGQLRVADSGARSSVVYTGRLTCSRCHSPMDVEVERNPNAVSANQPAFAVVKHDASPGDKPVGHLFIGTIKSSPVLYYGALNHCGPEQRLAVFYNRAMRDRSDNLLIVMPSTSGQTNSSPAVDEEFTLS